MALDKNKVIGSSLAAPNLFANPSRIDTFERKLESKDPFQMIDGSYKVFDNIPQNVDQITKLRSHRSGNKYIFKSVDGTEYLLSKFHKNSEFGSNKSSLNSQGKALADAGERATIASFYKEMKEPADTGEQLFVDHPDAFARWMPSFVQTKAAMEKVVGRGFETKFNVIHDSTDGGKFTKVINDFCKKIKMNKDSWNPSDIWLISKQKKRQVEDALEKIVVEHDGDVLAMIFNSAIYKFFEEKLLIPVSLKQITAKSYKIEYTNVPGTKVPMYDVEIRSFITDLKIGTKEIGGFTFTNKETGQPIRMQTKGYPFTSVSTQTEITTDGSQTGGRVGKVPAAIIEEVYVDNKFFRIKPVQYFSRDMSKTPTKQIDEWVNWYKTVVNHRSVSATIPAAKIKDHLVTLLKSFGGTKQEENIQAFKHKIQGLAMQYFFVINEKKLNTIITKYILGAKKINTKSGFFIKVY